MVPDGEGGTSLSYKAPFLTYNSKSARGEAMHYIQLEIQQQHISMSYYKWLVLVIRKEKVNFIKRMLNMSGRTAGLQRASTNFRDFRGMGIEFSGRKVRRLIMGSSKTVVV